MKGEGSKVTDEHALVHGYVRAMQQGAAGHDMLLSLFHDDGEYIESFSGQPQAHHGRAAIGAWLAESRQHQPPDIAITVDRIDIDGDHIRAAWTCDSSAFTAPARGIDTYLVRAGRIQRLETVLTQPPGLR
jgi:SnoaL-like protein